MSRPDTHTLSVLLEREEAARDEAKRACQRALEALRAATHQLQMLVDYRGEYGARWQQQFRQSAGPEILQFYRSFMLKLDQAIEQQQAALAGAQAHVQRCRERLVAAETRAAAVRKLIERREAEHARQQGRREAKETDEIAQRLGWLAARRAGYGAMSGPPGGTPRTVPPPEAAPPRAPATPRALVPD